VLAQLKASLRDFVRAGREAGLTNQVRVLKHGDTYTFNVLPRPVGRGISRHFLVRKLR
jgi:hypothetical protein